MKNYRLYPRNWRLIRKATIKKQGNKCQDCGKIGTRNYPLHVDHIDGNKMNCKPDNLNVLCPSCHLKKGIKSGQINIRVLKSLNKFKRIKSTL